MTEEKTALPGHWLDQVMGQVCETGTYDALMRNPTFRNWVESALSEAVNAYQSSKSEPGHLPGPPMSARISFLRALLLEPVYESISSAGGDGEQ